MRTVKKQILKEAFKPVHQHWISEVEEALEKGFKTKSQKKDSLSILGRIWEDITEQISDEINEQIAKDYKSRGLTTTLDEFGGLPPEYIAWEENYADPEREKAELPMYLTHVREQHLQKIQTYFPEHYDNVVYIKNLLDTIKAAEVTPLPPKQDPLEKKVEAKVKSVFDIMAKRQKQFTEAVDFGEMFGGLNVSAWAHRGQSKYGTPFTRVFYYLNGRVTPLNVIVAAAQELEKQGKDVPALQDSDLLSEGKKKTRRFSLKQIFD